MTTPHTAVFVTFKVPGFHCWAAAPSEVGFLASSHRHVFHFKVVVSEDHDFQQDMRETEFLLLQRFCEKHVKGFGQITALGMDFQGASCENLAMRLAGCLENNGHTVRSVEVSEDGENGAIVTFE